MVNEQDRKIRRRQRTDPKVVEFAEAVYNESPEPSHAEIARRLDAEFPEKAVSAVAIGDWIRKGLIRKDPDSAPWSMETAEPTDLELVNEITRYRARLHAGDPLTVTAAALGIERPFRKPTRGQARWVVRIRRAYPELSDLELIWHAASVAARGNSAAVEGLMTYAPWRDGAESLAVAVRDGIEDYGLVYEFGLERPVNEHITKWHVANKETAR